MKRSPPPPGSTRKPNHEAEPRSPGNPGAITRATYCGKHGRETPRPPGILERGNRQEAGVEDELIRWCALATRAACSQMTAPHLKALQDSVGQARSLPARFAWDRKAIVHTEILNLLAEAVTDRPVPALLLNRAVGAVHDLILTVGPAADGMILSSRRRLLDLIRAGDADEAAAEMEDHLRGLHFMWRLSRTSEPGGIAVLTNCLNEPSKRTVATNPSQQNRPNEKPENDHARDN